MRKRASRIDRVANRLDALPRGLSDFVGAFLQTGASLYSHDSQLTGAHETYIFRHSADLQTIFPLLALVPISIGNIPHGIHVFC
jgi:hypothetical protein